MAKSLDEIWRQMQAQRAAEQQRKMAQERAIYEQRERARQQYLNNMRLYEKSFVPTAAASAAAGGGRLPQQQTPDYPSVTAQSTIISWVDIADDLWKFVVYNFDSGQLSEIHTTDLTGTDWTLNSDENDVQYKGFTLYFFKTTGPGLRFYFVNAEGTVVGEKNLDSVTTQHTERAVIYYGNLAGVATVYYFDGDNVRTHIFEGLSASQVDVNDGSGEDVTQDGSMFIEAPDNNSTYYIARPNGDLVDISQYLTGGGDSFRSDYNASFILKRFTMSSISIISQEGTLLNTFDISSFNMDSLNESYFYGENCALFDYDNGVDTRLIISYDQDINQFVTLTFSNVPGYNLFYHRRSWYDGVSSFGKNLNVASYLNSSTDSIGDICTELNFWWLPKGATEFNNINLSSIGTFSYVGGDEGFTSNRSFTLGENPIFMYAPEDGEIIVAFLEESGYSTQSTGILSASCSNIWGHNIGEHSFAVFDVGSDRIWQMYDANSIVDETHTNGSWNWGDEDTRYSLRNGTLAVIDSLDTSNSFIYTTEIGLTSGPTGLGKIYNNINYGNNTGLSHEYQVISQYIPGEEGNEYVEGFYVLSKSGLSNYVEFFGGSATSSYTINDYTISSEMISFKFEEQSTGIDRYQVYNTTTLALLHDWDTGQTDTSYNSYDNRFVAEYDDGSGNVEFRLVSLTGVEILNLQTTEYNRESNDVVDND
jgi:hypothetical protein